MTATDKKKLAAFDKLDARLDQYEAMKGLTEAQLVTSDRIMFRMAMIRDCASPELRKALKQRGWQ